MSSFDIPDFPKTTNPMISGHKRPFRPRIDWIADLPPNLAARVKLPAEIEVEARADGVALVTLCEEPFCKGDAAGLVRPHALEAALRPIQS